MMPRTLGNMRASGIRQAVRWSTIAARSNTNSTAPNIVYSPTMLGRGPRGGAHLMHFTSAQPRNSASSRRYLH